MGAFFEEPTEVGQVSRLAPGFGQVESGTVQTDYNQSLFHMLISRNVFSVERAIHQASSFRITESPSISVAEEKSDRQVGGL